MKDSIVSVIVPVYNKEKYLRTCMDSLLRQTLFEVEFICINDGSTDSSLKILEEYCRDSRVRVYDQRNHGTGYTRNKGIDLANGKYLMFLDADDFFEEDMLALLVKKAEKSSADITICGAIKFDTQLCKDVGENWWLNTKPFSTDVIEADNNCDILLLTESCVWNKLYRRGFVIENELRFQNLKNNNDTAFSLISLCLASIVAYVDRIFVHYRINHDGDSISANRGQHLECSIQAFDAIISALRDRGKYSSFETGIMHQFCKSALYELSFCDDRTKGQEYIDKISKYLKGDDLEVVLNYYK